MTPERLDEIREKLDMLCDDAADRIGYVRGDDVFELLVEIYRLAAELAAARDACDCGGAWPVPE